MLKLHRQAVPTTPDITAAAPAGRGLRARPSRRSAAVLGCAVVAGISLAACNAASASAAPRPASVTADRPKVVPLVIYNGKNYLPGTAEAFTKATGIPTEEVSDSTGVLLAKIEAERNNPHWNIFWSDGAAAYVTLADQGLLVRNFEPDTGKLTPLGRRLVPANKSYIPTAITIAGAIVYNPSVTPHPPTNFAQLTEAKWHGAVGMNNPAISGPTYTAVAGIMNQMGGVARGEAYFKRLAANGLKVYTTNKVTLSALLHGQIKLAIVQNNAGVELAEKYHQLRVEYPVAATVLPSVIGIDAKMGKLEIAESERFAEFVYSAEGQKVMQQVNPYGGWPIMEGVTKAPLLPNLATLHLQFLDTPLWGSREATINEWFTANIVNG
jgi:iron(III) transport system substrate-binding protein